ncbi:hypothetical protein MSAN_01094200 [Mycena sanguinolenta]|uniref:Uncharacterized protein n=1 Tax=Mycena sanguinolenta TaxID=230812 RepID=A0A8H6YTG8_9AGAR|nr:hypothetical protein MSAN_01094200 [Mycena sanguinolenta]
MHPYASAASSVYSNESNATLTLSGTVYSNESNATLTPSEIAPSEFISAYDSGWFPEPSTPTQRLNAGLAAAIGSARLPKRSSFKSLLSLGRRKPKPPIATPYNYELPRIEQTDFDFAPTFDKSEPETTISNSLPSLPLGTRPPRKSKSVVFSAKGKHKEPVDEAELPNFFESEADLVDETDTDRDSQSPPASSAYATFSEARTSTETLVRARSPHNTTVEVRRVSHQGQGRCGHRGAARTCSVRSASV